MSSTESTANDGPTVALQAENARLIALLNAHGIEWRLPSEPSVPAIEDESPRLTTTDKVALFRRLFRGRTDVYPMQYAGRLHREHTGKTNVRIIDFVDIGHPVLLRMWDKRQRGYRAMGYRIGEESALSEQVPALFS